MTNTELNKFRRVLENRRSEIGSGSSNREALAVATSPDEMDRIQHACDRDYAVSSLERNSNQLRDVQAALRRMDAGAFGICIGCEEDINPKRLAAIPWASSCIVCQEAADCGGKTPRSGIDTSFEMTT